ncbi:MAG: thiopeptide-type bacteriocin biosynthesis protein, partial [Candidatus Eremiobacterota bacterium]
VGPNLGAIGAGRNLGRFADLLGARGALEEVARFEEEADPERLCAELTYLPRKLRSANVAVRPRVRRWEIALGVSPSGPTVPVAELVVGVREGRFYVRWPARETEVVVRDQHMLNYRNAPDVCHFLAHYDRDAGPQLHPFDWGPASTFPFLPRVVLGKTILSPARWRFPAGADLTRWRAEWEVPRYVHVGIGDVRLMLDLEDPIQAAELARSRERTVLEALPTPGEVWVPGPGGRFVVELVVSLALRRPVPRPAGRVAQRVAGLERLRPPGSEWLYLKLYTAPEQEDDLLLGPVRGWLEREVDGLFFARYLDPDPHLRVRLRGEPAKLLPLAAEAGELVTAGLCTRVAVDTYEREIERYGGDRGLPAAEELFLADSRTVLGLLAFLRQHPEVEPTLAAAFSLDALVESLGVSEGLRVRLRREGPRRAKRDLAARLEAAPDGLPLDPAGLTAPGRRLREAVPDGLEGVAASLVHMHCNRLLGRDRAREREAIALWLRLRDLRRWRRETGRRE